MSSLNILVIEDDRDFAEGLAGDLETGGRRVVSSARGPIASTTNSFLSEQRNLRRDNGEAASIGLGNYRGGTGHQTDVLRPAQIVDLVDHYSVAVEKERRPPRLGARLKDLAPDPLIVDGGAFGRCEQGHRGSPKFVGRRAPLSLRARCAVKRRSRQAIWALCHVLINRLFKPVIISA